MPKDISRRELLGFAVASPLWVAFSKSGKAPRIGLDLEALRQSPARALLIGEPPASARIEVVREWNGPLCSSRLVNRSRRAARVREVVLFDVSHGLPPETKLYGEGFQMLSQTAGSLGQPVDLGTYTDARHYRIPMPADARTFYGVVTLAPHAGDHRLLAFTSCRRFSGQFHLNAQSLRVTLDMEGRELAPGASWQLEEFTFRSGPDRERLLAELAERLAANHPPLLTSSPPTGWCSWYCFGPRVTATQVLENLDFIARHVPGLRYVQIDDGYQPAMGDWLETGGAFGGDVQGVLRAIRERGFEPAIWVAPFIAEAGSHLFERHPDWFVKDEKGAPLPSDRVTFGGWRRGPWYALDGTHPDAQRHLEALFRTMRDDWGCTYFKLDANFWGAIHGGRFTDPHATRVEAYRRGMEAIRRGARDGFLLGCNHPIWPSLGLLHGSRSSDDVKRTWSRVASTARQNLSRNWQNGRLWWNDPDAVVLTGELGEEERRFHATAVLASGGMLLSGDDLTHAGSESLDMLRKLLPPAGVAARFEDSEMRIAEIRLPAGRTTCLLNWDDDARQFSIAARVRGRVRELWTGAVLEAGEDGTLRLMVPGRSGRVLLTALD